MYWYGPLANALKCEVGQTIMHLADVWASRKGCDLLVAPIRHPVLKVLKLLARPTLFIGTISLLHA